VDKYRSRRKDKYPVLVSTLIGPIRINDIHREVTEPVVNFPAG
jgi:hypothetical protein